MNQSDSIEKQAVEKIAPKKGEVIFINKNTMLHILKGTGGIEIDFSSYHSWQDKLIFLEAGQYIKFLSDDFSVRKVDFDNETIHQNKSFRVLFKHLVSTGYINFDECSECQKYLDSSIFSSPDKILDVSSAQWYWQNPFKAKKEEYHLIFDVKDVIDKEYKNHIGTQDIIQLLDSYHLNPQRVYTEKVGITIKALQSRKLLSETQKDIAFTDKSIKEIAYDYGFKDPAYFNRFFKSRTGSTPNGFRESHASFVEDHFIEDVYELINSHHHEYHKVGFYADEMNLSIQSLSKKVKEKLNISIGQLIRLQLIKSAKAHLAEGRSIKEVSRLLHFEEPNHFSSFFKHYTGNTPVYFQTRKVQ